MKLKISILLICLVSSIHTWACSCIGFDLDLPIQELGLLHNHSEIDCVIFKGVLIESYPSSGKSESTEKDDDLQYKIDLAFKVTSAYKGNLDSIQIIRTNNSIGACGLMVEPGDSVLIIGSKEKDGFYHSYREDCQKSINKSQDSKRFKKYVAFLESIKNMRDGAYEFKQAKYLTYNYPEWAADTLDLIIYSISKGNFDGLWKVTNRKGLVMEEGNFADGKKTGTWVYTKVEEKTEKYLNEITTTEFVQYKNGKPANTHVKRVRRQWDGEAWMILEANEFDK